MSPSVHQGSQPTSPPWAGPPAAGTALAASFIGRDSSSFSRVISIISSTGAGKKPVASSFSTPTKVLVGGYRGGAPIPQCSTSAALARGSPDSVAMAPHHNGGLPLSFVPVSSCDAPSRRPFSRASNSGHDSPSSSGPSSSSSSCRGGSNGGCHPHFGGSANFVYGSPAAPSKKKYKTEMCKYIESGYCKYGESCLYAHSELERNPPCAKELRKDDQLLLPCSIMVSTGFW